MPLFTGSRLEEKKKKKQGCNTKDTAVSSGRELFLDQGEKKRGGGAREREKKEEALLVLQSNLVPFLKEKKKNPIDSNFHTI